MFEKVNLSDETLQLLSHNLFRDCIKLNYAKSGTFRWDVTLSGLQNKVVPIDLDDDKYVDLTWNELNRQALLPGFFLLAILEFPEDSTLRSALSLMVKDVKTPVQIAPKIFARLTPENKQYLEKLWKELQGHDPLETHQTIQCPKNMADIITMGIFHELAKSFSMLHEVKILMAIIEFPTSMIPETFYNFESLWFDICECICKGAIENGIAKLIIAAAGRLPGNLLFKKFAQACKEQCILGAVP